MSFSAEAKIAGKSNGRAEQIQARKLFVKLVIFILMTMHNSFFSIRSQRSKKCFEKPRALTPKFQSK